LTLRRNKSEEIFTLGNGTAASLEFDPDKIKAHIAWASEYFYDIQSQAEQSMQKGNFPAAVVWAQIAADFAFHRHPGFYASPSLESLLQKVAENLEEETADRINMSTAVTAPGTSSKPRILHVVTQALRTGGHTRLLARLINNSSDRYVHNLVSTTQKTPLPNWLFSAIEASGGRYTALSLSTPKLLKRASALRRLGSCWADIVFLHIHPHDAVPLLAFGRDGGPPVIIMNHADHGFWLGANIADVVADYRLAGQAITLSQRGARVSGILPIPLSDPCERMPGPIAREKLGISGNSVVLLTIASPYKFTPYGGYDFLETITGILSHNKRAVLLAVGPAAEARWLEASRRVEGRIMALGKQSDLKIYHACADVYLDSFPFGSFTSVLEAGILGVPVVGMTNIHAPMYTNLDVTSEKSKTHADSMDEYRSLLEMMIENPDFRRVKGEECRAELSSIHLLPGWNNYLEKIIALLPGSHSVNRKIEVSAEINTNGIYLAGINALQDANYTYANSLRKQGRYFPFTTRCDLYIKSLRGKRKFGEFPFKTLIGEYPRLLVNRIVYHFDRLRKQKKLPI
jgi:glycosyltransferase involved in cell wall biosynthesis